MSRKTFQNFIYCLLLLPFSRAVVIKRYAEKSEFQNKLFSSSEMVEINSESLIQCAIQCTNKCSCFGFNDLKNTCRVYEDCNFDTVFEWDTGWVYHFASKLFYKLSFENKVLTESFISMKKCSSFDSS